jgi:transposase
LSTKIHAAVDSLGNPVRLILTQGQASEYGQADALIDSFDADYVLADKGYDSDDFIRKIESQGAIAVVPPRSHRLSQREYDKVIYKERNLVERLFLKLKSFRRIATRYERLVVNYGSLLYLAAATIWLA